MIFRVILHRDTLSPVTHTHTSESAARRRAHALAHLHGVPTVQRAPDLMGDINYHVDAREFYQPREERTLTPAVPTRERDARLT